MAVQEYKKGLWAASYYIKKSNGERVKKVKRGFTSKDDALKYVECHKGDVIPSDTKYQFSTVFELLAKSNSASPTTTASRRQRLTTYASTLWNKELTEISKEDLIAWRAELGKRNLATSSKNDIIGYVKQIFKYANEMYDIYDSAKVLKTFPKQLDDFKQLNIINYNQFMQLYEAEESFELKVFFRFLFMTGCRKGEARALLKSDFDGKRVHIYKAMRRYTSSISTTKTRTQRWVYLDNDTIELVNQLMVTDGEYLFGGKTPLSLTTIADHFNKDLEEVHLPHMRIHDLRHSNVSMLWAAGVPVAEISKRIGHSTPKTTMEVYSHIFDDKQDASLKYLNSL